MDFKVGVEGTNGCAGFRGELRIHVIPHVMRVVVTDRTIAKIANIRHGVLVYLQVKRLRLTSSYLQLMCLPNILGKKKLF